VLVVLPSLAPAQAFNFLWRLKRVEDTLSQVWFRHMAHAHEFRHMRNITGEPLIRCRNGLRLALSSLCAASTCSIVLMLNVSCLVCLLYAGVLQSSAHLRSEMVHFVQNLTNYIMFEVLEISWHNFVDKIKVGLGFSFVLSHGVHRTMLRLCLCCNAMHRTLRTCPS
jgi:hypothetical protein